MHVRSGEILIPRIRPVITKPVAILLRKLMCQSDLGTTRVIADLAFFSLDYEFCKEHYGDFKEFQCKSVQPFVRM